MATAEVLWKFQHSLDQFSDPEVTSTQQAVLIVLIIFSIHLSITAIAIPAGDITTSQGGGNL
jgi:hypothetical protein